ncbi:hypothetical protein DE146DRAFT_659447, partial [Phaeosphaeria sp. MPI-PUGE-AT-0046c]
MPPRNWLRATDRSRQRNGFLGYNDPDGECPRLVTRGLDHNALDNTPSPPYQHYLSDPPREHEHTYVDPTWDPMYLLLLQDVESARKRQGKIGIKRSSSLSDYLHRPRSMRNIFPCMKSSSFNPTRRHSTNIHRTSTFELSTIHTDSQSHNDSNLRGNNQILDPTATPPYLDPAINLIFAGASQSARAYIRQTRRGIKRSTISARALAPSLNSAGLGPDPHHWHEWDERNQRGEDARAHWRFLVGRLRPSLSSRARRRGQEGMSGIGPREMKREANAIFARN